MHLGRNICCVRELLNIKQQTLAELLKVSQQTVSKIEQTQKLCDSVIERIARALGVEVGVILYYDETKIINYLRVSDAIEHSFEQLGHQVAFLKKIVELYEKHIVTERKISGY